MPSRMKTSILLAAFASLSLLACDEAVTDKGPEDDVPTDGKLDSFAHPTDHGAIAFGTPAVSSLTAAAQYHTWTFSLTGGAQVHLYTDYAPSSHTLVDTVVYLYKRGPNGWGSYLVRNDDDGSSRWSSIAKDLGAGDYRVLVKGYASTTRGKFAVTVDCDGAGCNPAPPPATCLFGATFGDLLESTAYRITNDAQLHATDYLSPLDQQRVVLALQQSAHTDVMTVAQAFDAADQHVIRRLDLYDEAGGRAFTAFEYGAGDNSYGAVFAYGVPTIVAVDHDTDLESCTVHAQVCALGSDWAQTRASAAFTRGATRVITSAGQLTGTDAADALAAIRVAHPEAASLADGLTRVDDKKLNVTDLTHTATGTKVRAFEYGAGDSSYGAIYQAGTATRFASIVDLTYYDCSFAP
ncbi:MAG TPA: hypothetical protein VHE35_32865 [Kofleriaceae bacterium]|nr:hypothetical protein [Kofleriaceae bacterium]